MSGVLQGFIIGHGRFLRFDRGRVSPAGSAGGSRRGPPATAREKGPRAYLLSARVDLVDFPRRIVLFQVGDRTFDRSERTLRGDLARHDNGQFLAAVAEGNAGA